MRTFALALVVMFAGCRCRGEQATADDPKLKKADEGLVKACLEGVRGLSRYNDRCENSHLWWGSVERAVDQLRPACERLVVAPGARFERAEIEKCNAALEKAPCFAPLPVECRIGGTLKDGEPCAFGAQCANGLFCHQPEESVCGHCRKTAASGADCGEGQCDEGLTCVAGTCGPPVAAGSACLHSGECAKPFVCNTTGVGAGQCVPARKEGESCDAVDCEVTLRCAEGVCKPRGNPQPPGAACNDMLDCVDYACVAGRCVAPLGVGKKCSHESAPCEPSLMCIRGKCVLPDARECR